MSSCFRSITAAGNRILPSLNLSNQILSPETTAPEFRQNYTAYQLNRRRGIVLRSKLCVIKAVGPAGDGETFGSERGDSEVEKNDKARRCCSYGAQDVQEITREKNRTAEVIVAASVTVVLGVGNRVLYKLALVPLKHYPFFLAQLATFGYFYCFPPLSHLTKWKFFSIVIQIIRP